MRISVWSSGVCSAELVALIGRYFGGKEGLFREAVMDEKHPKLFREPTDIGDLPAFLAQLVIEDEADDREHRMEKFVIMLRSAASQIGRASCRERVCQYV